MSSPVGRRDINLGFVLKASIVCFYATGYAKYKGQINKKAMQIEKDENTDTTLSKEYLYIGKINHLNISITRWCVKCLAVEYL